MQQSWLKWQCRRGMRELDDLLLNYLQQKYDQAADADKQAFRTILQLPDPELVGYLLNNKPPADELQRVIANILDRTQT